MDLPITPIPPIQMPDGSTRDYRICPNCGERVEGAAYDIGSGPELCCSNCETCFGAEGQDLDPRDAFSWIAEDPEMRKRMGWDDEDGKPRLMLASTQCRECGKTIWSKWLPETGTQPVETCANHQ